VRLGRDHRSIHWFASPVLCVVAVVLGVLHGEAAAGRTYYGWLYGTEVMPERGVELQNWIQERNRLGDNDLRETLFWWGPLVGVTDQLELALPMEITWDVADGAESNFTFRRFGIEARYRFVTQDPEDAPPFAPLVRFAVKRDVVARDRAIVELDLVASYESGRMHLLADAGIVGAIDRDDTHFEARPGAGISFRTTGDLRLGAEVYAELSLDSGGVTWAAAGPNIAWTHGRFWLSGAFGIGIYNIRAAPRVMWGILF
jgi:hypothetical protein